MNRIELQEVHAALWARFENLLAHHRVPQSLLFVGVRDTSLLSLVNRLVAALLCEGESVPCGTCRACHLFLQGGHPDVCFVQEDGGTIKIDQIRSLQQDVYHTPQCGSRRVIVINSVNQMNLSAANALLKILEEPPSHTQFVLVADHVSGVPATILSRCQRYNVPSPSLMGTWTDYLALGQHAPEGSARMALYQQREQWIATLSELIDGKVSPCAVAKQWATLAWTDILWFLYLITARAIQDNFFPGHDMQRTQFAQRLPCLQWFRQLDHIRMAMQQANQQIHLNETLALEVLLLGYTSFDTHSFHTGRKKH